MMVIVTKVLGWLSGGFLTRAMGTVDKYIDAQTDRDRIKADVVQSYYATRGAWMAAGGFWLLLMFAVPTALHYASVVLYSMLWCAGCAYPQDWTIAALPGTMGEWEGWIVLACIGGVGSFAWKR